MSASTVKRWRRRSEHS
ncbi:hypothetical protein ACFWD6_01825 [Streptomyces diastaticus]